MINLLPTTEKKIIQREYHLRRWTLILTFVLCLVVLADILLFPSYILMLYRLKISQLDGEVKPNTVETTERNTISTQLKQFQSVVSALQPQSIQPLPTHILDIVINDKTSSNILTSFSYNQDGTNPFTLSIQGIAENRQSLLSFVEALRKEPEISNVNLPISDFTKDTSISFSFDVTGTNSKP